jgi:hypothetical protein
MSLFFLAQKAIGFGLAQAMQDLRDYYVTVFHPIAQALQPVAVWVMQWLSLPLPEWWKDGVVIYLAVAGATFRTFYYFGDGQDSEGFADIYFDGLFAAVRFLSPVLALIWPVSAVIGFLGYALLSGISDEYSGAFVDAAKGGWRFVRQFATEIFLIVCGVFTFVAINAGL